MYRANQFLSIYSLCLLHMKFNYFNRFHAINYNGENPITIAVSVKGYSHSWTANSTQMLFPFFESLLMTALTLRTRDGNLKHWLKQACLGYLALNWLLYC